MVMIPKPIRRWINAFVEEKGLYGDGDDATFGDLDAESLSTEETDSGTVNGWEWIGKFDESDSSIQADGFELVRLFGWISTATSVSGSETFELRIDGYDESDYYWSVRDSSGSVTSEENEAEIRVARTNNDTHAQVPFDVLASADPITATGGKDGTGHHVFSGSVGAISGSGEGLINGGLSDKQDSFDLDLLGTASYNIFAYGFEDYSR